MTILKSILLVATTILSQRLWAEAGWQTLGNVVSVRQQDGSEVELTAQRGKVRVIALSPRVIRVTYTTGSKFQDLRSFAWH